MSAVAGIEPDIALLAARDHHEPHRVLGAHPADGGVALRVWRPGATAVRVIPDGGAPIELEHRASGLFEAIVAGSRNLPRYEVEVELGGLATRGRDPYSFLPTVGELDLHLVGEGRHQELWERLGAHPREIDGAAGVAFTVWAPSARSVSVVGDWNGWDGMVHPMRTLGSSGVWELFVPGVGEGSRYKFEIRGADGSLRLKADPEATRRRAPAENRLRGLRQPSPLGGRRLDARPRGAAAPRGAGVDLRGAPAARGGGTRWRATGRWATWSWRRSSATTRWTWASPTSSCCR